MDKATLFATVLVAGFGASHVEAQALKGSDTLEAVTNNIIANCPTATGITYLGGGSGGGENAMAAVRPRNRSRRCRARLPVPVPVLTPLRRVSYSAMTVSPF